jgi:hypothetical protein
MNSDHPPVPRHNCGYNLWENLVMKHLVYASWILFLTAALVLLALAKSQPRSASAAATKMDRVAIKRIALGTDDTSAGTNITVVIHPKNAPVTSKVTRRFRAVVNGSSNQAVTWYVDGMLGGSKKVGTIDPTGLYTPPSNFVAGQHVVKAVSQADPTKLARAALFLVSYEGFYTNRYDNSRTGQNLQETVLTPANVNVNTFGRLFAFKIDGGVNAQPLYVANVNIPNPENGNPGYHNVLYVATEHDTVFAFDADGKVNGPLWHTSFINPPNVVTVPGTCFGTGIGELGIMATPVIDPASSTIYLEARTLENPTDKCTGTYVHKLHALDITSGQEKFGGPVIVQASVPGSGAGSVNGVVSFDPRMQNVRPGLLLYKTSQDSNNIVYFGSASLEDLEPYHGWVLGYDSQTLALKYVYNTTANGKGGGIWQKGAGLAADDSGNIYAQTGNGTYDNDHGDYGQAALKLTPSNGNLTLTDFFSPANRKLLDGYDWDMSSGGLLLLPDQPGNHPHLMVGGGKEGTIYLMDRDNLGGYNSGGDAIVQEIVGAIRPSVPHHLPYYGLWNTAGYFQNNVYIFGKIDYPKMFTLNNGLLPTTATSTGTRMMNDPSPVISANGSSNGIVWMLECDIKKLSAYDPNDLTHEYYDSNQKQWRDQPHGQMEFLAPTVANGHVYVATTVEVAVYGLVQ